MRPTRPHVLGIGPCLVLCVVGAQSGAAQQLNDPDFQFENLAPAFPIGQGPSVCIDEAHHNRHTIQQLFGPFADIMRSDGFRPTRLTESLSNDALAACDIVVLGLGSANDLEAPEFWVYPHASAYTRTELDATVRWVRAGGALLLITDHSPAAGAAAGLAAVLGVQTLDAWATVTPQGRYPELVRRIDGLLAEHPIIRGRGPSEQIDSLATHGAGAFFPSVWIEPVMRFGPGATAFVYLDDMGQELSEIGWEEWPKYDIEGWLLAGTREWGSGRIVFFGDVTACTAQVYGPDATPIAMSHPTGAQNPQFCLNMVRWLARVL